MTTILSCMPIVATGLGLSFLWCSNTATETDLLCHERVNNALALYKKFGSSFYILLAPSCFQIKK